MTVLRCDGCYTEPADGRPMFFTVTGTDHLAPQIVPTVEAAELLAEGWTVTMHDHERRPHDT